MDKILLVIAITFLYSSSSFAVEEDRYSEGFQYSLVSYHKDGFDGTRPTPWNGKYGQLTNESVTLEERSLDDPLNRKVSFLGSSIGFEVSPFYGTNGVFRTSSSDDKSTYIAVGFMMDELAVDEAGWSDSKDDSVFSYGFGINNPSYNIEYMMSLDEEDFDFSTISLAFTSEF